MNELIEIKLERELVASTEYDYERLKEETKVTYEDPPEKPKTLLKMKSDFGFAEYFTVGDISAVVGRSGNGKSNLLSLIVSEMINNNNTNYFQSQLDPEKPIIYLDTEQSDYDVWRVVDRIARISGISTEDLEKRLMVKKTMSIPPEWRKKLMYDLISEYKPQLVILDGVADVVDSINDEAIAKKTVMEIRKYANESGAHLIGVIHSSDKNTQSKEAMGWLGTVWKQKSEGQMNVQFDARAKEHKVSFHKGRHGFPEDWSFKFDAEQKIPVFVEPSESSIEETDYDRRDQYMEVLLGNDREFKHMIFECFNKSEPNKKGKMSKNAMLIPVTSWIKDKASLNNDPGKRWISEILDLALERGYIENNGTTNNPDFILNINENFDYLERKQLEIDPTKWMPDVEMRAEVPKDPDYESMVNNLYSMNEGEVPF